MKKTVKNLITWSPSHLITSQKSAFTLAEVLITLAIIGVVAAMTIPTLMQNFTNRVVETKLQKIYSLMNQVITLSELDNGPKEFWPSSCNGEGNISCEDYYAKYIFPYIRTQKIEHADINSQGNVIINFADGSLLIGKNTEDYFFYPNAKNYDKDNFLIMDENQTDPQRPTVGITSFTFRFAPQPNVWGSANRLHNNRGFEAYMYGISELTKENLINPTNDYACQENASINHYCTALIKMNNWKIPKDYPFNVKN